jgi:hypothetical protein
VCEGEALTAFVTGLTASNNNSWTLLRQVTVNREAPQDEANGETKMAYKARLQRARDGAVQPAYMDPDILSGIQATMNAVFPYRTLENQKRFMRRKMRKPTGMSTRQYVNHMTRINTVELPFLPPFRGDAGKFTDDKFREIILFGLPNGWKKEMDKFDFDPFGKSVVELVEFCECMEVSADETGHYGGKENSNEVPRKRSSLTRPTKSHSSNGKKWCDYHETDTHSTKDCDVLKKLKASKSGTSGSSNPAKKQWKSKSEYAKDKRLRRS